MLVRANSLSEQSLSGTGLSCILSVPCDISSHGVASALTASVTQRHGYRNVAHLAEVVSEARFKESACLGVGG